MAKDKIAKTNAARLLDRDKVKYELVPYEVDENDLSCVHVAATLGENIEQVFKTLVLQGDKSGYFVCVIPGEHEIDLKLAAKISGNKKCDLIPMKELLPLTGYIRGFPDAVPRCVCRLFLQQQGVPEKRITQELVVFPRDKIVFPATVLLYREICRGQRCYGSIQKRITAPLGAAIPSFLSVPYRTLRSVWPLMRRASCSARYSSNGTHGFFFLLSFFMVFYPFVPMVVLNSYTALSSLMTGPCTVAVVSSG